MDKAVVTLLIRSFRGGQETIAHYLYALSYYIIAVTGGGRTEISFIPFQGRIQRSVAITYPFKEQPDSTRQIHGRSRWYSLQSAFSQEKKVQNQIYLNTKRDRLHFCKRSLLIWSQFDKFQLCLCFDFPLYFRILNISTRRLLTSISRKIGGFFYFRKNFQEIFEKGAILGVHFDPLCPNEWRG